MNLVEVMNEGVNGGTVAVDDLLKDLPGIAILLREARGAYGGAIREAVALAGMQPLPINGPLIVGGLHEGVPFPRLVSQRKCRRRLKTGRFRR